uniref:Uncharacterized protein n=1 Tax=Amphimedon queenslandica TaxID=400682 RepID=A0A1X7TXQ6_AMPQE
MYRNINYLTSKCINSCISQTAMPSKIKHQCSKKVLSFLFVAHLFVS